MQHLFDQFVKEPLVPVLLILGLLTLQLFWITYQIYYINMSLNRIEIFLLLLSGADPSKNKGKIVASRGRMPPWVTLYNGLMGEAEKKAKEATEEFGKELGKE